MTAVVVINPLPRALRHYETAVLNTLSPWGFEVLLEHVDLERSAWPSRTGIGRLGRTLLSVSRYIWIVITRQRGAPALVLWPAFGYFDVLLLSVLRRRTLLVFHDPRPLRPQRGYGRVARLVARTAAKRDTLHVSTHSRRAQRELAEDCITAQLVLHPVTPKPREENQRRENAFPLLVVAGAYKPSRDTSVLREVAEQLPGWRFRVCGAAWPEIGGWDRHDWFHTEQEFDSDLRAADVILIAYAHYYASGVLLRAIEQGTPVVSARNSFAEEVLGLTYPGLVDRWTPIEITAAVQRVRGEGPALSRRLSQYAMQCGESWRAYVSSV